SRIYGGDHVGVRALLLDAYRTVMGGLRTDTSSTRTGGEANHGRRGEPTMYVRTLGLYPGILVAISAASAWATPFAYVGSTAGGSPSIKVIDTATDTVVATIPVDTAVGGVAVNPVGSRVYVTPYSTKVIDTATNTVITTIPNLGTTFSPTVSPDGTRLYVLNYTGAYLLQVIDTATNTQLTTI